MELAEAKSLESQKSNLLFFIMTKRNEQQVIDMVTLFIEKHCPLDIRPLRFWFTRSKTIAGSAYFKGRKPYAISLSLYYVLNPFVTNRSVVNTILHELAHIISPYGSGHGPAWKKNAQKIGAKPVRVLEKPFLSRNWRTTCPKCKKFWFFHKKPKGKSYRCPCGVRGLAVRKCRFGHFVRWTIDLI